jgi:transmembrane protein DUF3566
MSSTPEDLTSPSGDEGVRIDAPSAPDSGSVASGPAAPTPPRRARRTASAQVSASSPAVDTVAEPVVAPLDDGDDRRARVKDRKARRAPRTRATTGPVRASGPRSERRYRQTVVKVDLWSVTKLSLCFYLSAMFVTLVAMIALWVIADAAGYVHSIEKFLGELLSAEKGSFKFLSGEVLRGTILVGLVIVALQVVITVVGASFYNIFAELFGGLEITVKEEEAPPRM